MPAASTNSTLIALNISCCVFNPLWASPTLLANLVSALLAPSISVPDSLAAKWNAWIVSVAIPVIVEVLPTASIKSKDFWTRIAKAVAVAPAAKPTPAKPFAAPALAPPIVFKPLVTLLNAALVLLITANSNLIFCFAIIPLFFC